VNTISYTTNGGDSWTSISIANTTFNSVFIYDEKRAIAVGNDGVLYYTNNGYSTWNIVPDILLNSGGNSDILNGSSVTLRSIYMPDINSFVISRNIQSYSANNQLGLSKIYYCHFPNLFNRSQNNVVDISGSIQLGGDLNINEGGNLYVNQDSILNGYLYVSKDATIIGNLNVTSRIINNADVIMRSSLFVDKDISLNGRLCTSGDVSLNENLYLAKTM
jgi:hypothetical protein